MTDLFQANALVPRQQLPDIARRRAGLIAEIGAGRHRRPRRVLRLIVVAAAIVVPATIALAEAGVPSPFFDLGAADRPTAPGDAIDPAMRAKLEQQNAQEAGQAAQGWPASTLAVDQARLVLTAPDGSKLYVIPTTDKNLCVLIEHGGDLGEGSSACLSPLDASHPATGVFEGPTAGRPGRPLRRRRRRCRCDRDHIRRLPDLDPRPRQRLLLERPECLDRNDDQPPPRRPVHRRPHGCGELRHRPRARVRQRRGLHRRRGWLR